MDRGLKQAAVMVVLRSGDALLLLCRNKEPNLGKYVPVGGHLEPHEAPRAAALREVQEETGYELEDLQFCGVVVETSPTSYNWILFVYSADVERRSPPPCREGQLEWVEYSRVPQLPTPDTDMYIYRRILAARPFVFTAEYDASLCLFYLRDELSGQVLRGAPG